MIHTVNLTLALAFDNPCILSLQALAMRKALNGIKLFPPLDPDYCRSAFAVLHIDFLKVIANWEAHAVNVRPEHLPRVKEAVNKYLGLAGMCVDDFKLSRIDYAQSAVMDSPENFAALFRTLQKAPTRGGYTTRKRSYESSIYSKSKSKAIQVYDKPKERADKGFAVASYEENVVRAEIQLKRNHLHYKAKKGVPRTWDAWINEERYHEYIGQLPSFIYRGDFYSLERATRMVELSGLKDSMKTKLINFLTVVSEKGADAMKTVAKSYNTRRKYVDLLASLGVNPLTIPSECRVDHIKMPFDFT